MYTTWNDSDIYQINLQTHFSNLIKAKYYISIAACWCINTAYTQQLLRNYNIPVTHGEALLNNAWAGGFNSCQISTFDANLDGLQDIFVFDRIGSRISVFINMDGTSGAMDYKYTLAYNHLFPSNMRNWTLLRDMNCDGKKDICTNVGSGFKIYWNTSETELSFNPTSSGTMKAEYDFGDPYRAGIYSIAPDLPAIDDYDDDGDMDIWTWNDYGTALFFYKNNAIENGDCGTIDTIDYECRNRCYGMFGESTESFSLFLDTNFSCGFNVVDPRGANDYRQLHTGGTVTTIDLDNNGQKDLILSDVTEANDGALLIVDAMNGVDSVASAVYDFPATYGPSSAVDLNLFPGNFYEDVNNDGVKDLLVSPNASSEAEDLFSILLYLNNGTNSLPVFELVTTNFLQGESIDLGTSCFPIAFDVDNDGLKDLLLSNRKHYNALVGPASKIAYYRNTGNAQNPAFVLDSDNWIDLPSLGFEVMYPTFGDLDNDSDDDMILGEQNGYLHYFTNTAALDQPCVFELTNSPVLDATNSDLDVGQNSTPQLVDINEDGKLDLIIGELNGSVNYYQNIGSNVAYNYQLIEDTIGNAVATSVLGVQGKSIPFMYKNELDLWELIIGTETGQINHYNNIEGNFLGAFNLVTTDYENINEGDRTSVFMSDLNADDVLDLLVGNLGGGLGLYMSPIVNVAEIAVPNDILLYPNPAQNLLELRSQKQSIQSITIFDSTGRWMETDYINSSQIKKDISNYAKGIYYLQILVGNITVNKILVVVR